MDRIVALVCLVSLSCAHSEGPSNNRPEPGTPASVPTKPLDPCASCFGDREVTPVLTRLEAQTRLLASLAIAEDLCRGSVWARHTVAATEATKQTLKKAACDHMEGVRSAKELIQPPSAREGRTSAGDDLAALDHKLHRAADAARVFCQAFKRVTQAEAQREGVRRVKGATGCQILVLESVRIWAQKAGSGG